MRKIEYDDYERDVHEDGYSNEKEDDICEVCGAIKKKYIEKYEYFGTSVSQIVWECPMGC